jgi:hypothetical protein
MDNYYTEEEYKKIQKESEFQRHRLLEDDYWDAVNDGSWARAGEKHQAMSYTIKENPYEYNKWKENEEKREKALQDIDKEYNEKRHNILNK